MTERTYTTSQLAELAAGLRRMLDAIEARELTADSGMVARLEGAAAAIDALAKGRDPTIDIHRSRQIGSSNPNRG